MVERNVSVCGREWEPLILCSSCNCSMALSVCSKFMEIVWILWCIIHVSIESNSSWKAPMLLSLLHCKFMKFIHDSWRSTKGTPGREFSKEKLKFFMHSENNFVIFSCCREKGTVIKIIEMKNENFLEFDFFCWWKSENCTGCVHRDEKIHEKIVDEVYSGCMLRNIS